MPPPSIRLLRAINGGIVGRIPRAAGVTTSDACIAGRPVRHYRPALAQGLVAYVHGGGFVSGSFATHDSLCSYLALALGAEVVAIDYRLAPEHPAPAQRDDVLAVVMALRGDGPLLLGGDSAGAYLAVIAALALRDAARPAEGLLLFNPFIDLAGGADTLHATGRGAVRMMRRLVGGDGYPSLLDLDLTNAPPAVIVWGGWLDPVAPGAAALATAWERAGVPVVRQRHQTLPHGGVNLAGRSPRARAVIAGAAMALRRLMDDGGNREQQDPGQQRRPGP